MLAGMALSNLRKKSTALHKLIDEIFIWLSNLSNETSIFETKNTISMDMSNIAFITYSL